MPRNDSNNNNKSNDNGNSGGGGAGSNGGSASAVSGPAFSIGTWFGVPITIHYSFFLVTLLSVIVSIRHLSWQITLYEFIIMGPILFITILIHEFGHIKMSQRLGGHAVEIILWPLGGLAVSSSPNPATPQNMLLVAAGGPATHIVQMFFWIILAIVFQALGDGAGWGVNYNVIHNGNVGDYFAMIAVGALYLNLILFLFNLLIPAYPLDGGQIFASALLMCGLPASTAAMITSIAGMIIAALLFVYALFSLFITLNPFSILNMLVAAWIFRSSYELYKMYENGTVMNHPLFRTAGNTAESTERQDDDV